MTIKTNHITIEHRELSILVSLYGLSFMLFNKQNNERKFFEYTFEKTHPEALLNHLQDILNERPLLTRQFDRIKIIHHNRLNTFVPSELFDASQTKKYLSYNIKLLPTDFVDFDEIKSFNVHNVYVPFVNVNNLFLNYNQSIEYQHSASVFLEKVHKLRKNIEALPVFEVYVNVYPFDFQIFVLQNEKIILFNHFEYAHIDDFLYYLFFVVEKLQIPKHSVQYYVGGIDKNSEIVQQLKFFSPYVHTVKAHQDSQINNWI